MVSDTEAIDALKLLPHEICERGSNGCSFNFVSDSHCDDDDVDDTINNESSCSSVNINKGKIKCTVTPRKEKLSNANSIEYNFDGSRYLTISTINSSSMMMNEVEIFDGETNKKLGELSMKMVQAATFSPKGKFVTIYQKGANVAGGTKEKNLSVWRLGDGGDLVKVFECFQKTFVKAEWPYMQFSKDRLCARCVTNEIQFYDTDSFGECSDEDEDSKGSSYNINNNNNNSKMKRIRVPGVALAKLSLSETEPKIAVFVPENKGIPGSVRIYNCPTDSSSNLDSDPQPVARKSFFRISEVDLKWAPDGSALLVCGYCEVDASNKNYYGESSLHFLASDGSLDCKVDLSKEGPVHDAQWSPTSENFAVCYGFMPAKTSIFDAKKCKATYELGAGPHNTIRWNPFGRFIMLAGFGNLPGDVKFYHRLFDGKFKLMGSCRAACSVTAEWSPCGRRLLTTTVAPRLNVDNGFKIWRYNGELLIHLEREKLYEAVWRPRKEGTFPSLGISKNSKRVEGGSSNGSANNVPEKPAAFVPPHLRNKSASSISGGMGSRSNSGNFSLATVSAEEARVGKVKEAVDAIAKKYSQPQKRVVPGAEPVLEETAAQKKNRKKAEAKKAKKLQEDTEKLKL